MVCTLPEGVGYDLKWAARVGAQDSANWEYNMTSYYPPNITSVTAVPGLLSTAGNESVIINGTDFGPAMKSNDDFIFGRV